MANVRWVWGGGRECSKERISLQGFFNRKRSQRKSANSKESILGGKINSCKFSTYRLMSGYRGQLTHLMGRIRVNDVPNNWRRRKRLNPSENRDWRRRKRLNPLDVLFLRNSDGERARDEKFGNIKLKKELETGKVHIIKVKHCANQFCVPSGDIHEETNSKVNSNFFRQTELYLPQSKAIKTVRYSQREDLSQIS